MSRLAWPAVGMLLAAATTVGAMLNLWLGLVAIAIVFAAIARTAAVWLLRWATARCETSGSSVVAKEEARQTVGGRLSRYLWYAGAFSMTWLQVRGASITVSDLLFLASIYSGVLAAIARRDRFSVVSKGLLLGVAVLVTGSLLTSMFGTDSGGLPVLGRILYLLVVWYYAATVTLRTSEHIRVAIAWWVAGAAINGIAAIGQVRGIVPADPENYGRASGLTEHVNDLGGAMAIALVPAITLAIATRKWRWATPAVLIATGLVLSGSVGAVAAALAGLSVVALDPRLTRWALVGLVAGVAALAWFAQAPAYQTSSFARIGVVTGNDVRYNTVSVRAVQYERAWERIKENPFIGVGLDPRTASIPVTSTESYQVHNLFLGRWYETGLLGLIGVLLIVAAMLRLGWSAAVGETSDNRLLALGVLGGVIAFVGVALTEPTLYQRYALMPGLLALCFVTAQTRCRSDQLNAATAPLPQRLTRTRAATMTRSTEPAC